MRARPILPRIGDVGAPKACKRAEHQAPARCGDVHVVEEYDAQVGGFAKHRQFRDKVSFLPAG